MEKRYIFRGFFLNFGGGGGGGKWSLLFFFFKIVATKQVLIWRLFPTKTHPQRFIPFQTKLLFPYSINLSPRDVNDKVAIITILIIKINKNAANLSYDLLFQINQPTKRQLVEHLHRIQIQIATAIINIGPHLNISVTKLWPKL